MNLNTLKGIEDELQARNRRVGIIRLGSPKVTTDKGKRMGREIPYFRLTDARELIGMCGEQPTSIPIVLPTESVNEFLWISNGRWNGMGRRVWQGHGRPGTPGEAMELVQNESGRYVFQQRECPCEHLITNDNPVGKDNPKADCRCDVVFQFYVPIDGQLPDAVYAIYSHSITLWRQLFTKMLSIRGRLGRIAGFPIDMVRVKAKIADPTTGKLRDHYLIDLSVGRYSIAEATAIRLGTHPGILFDPLLPTGRPVQIMTEREIEETMSTDDGDGIDDNGEVIEPPAEPASVQVPEPEPDPEPIPDPNALVGNEERDVVRGKMVAAGMMDKPGQVAVSAELRKFNKSLIKDLTFAEYKTFSIWLDEKVKAKAAKIQPVRESENLFADPD